MATKKSDTATERPYEDAKADPKDIEAAENRPTEDQIVDYREKFATKPGNDVGTFEENGPVVEQVPPGVVADPGTPKDD